MNKDKYNIDTLLDPLQDGKVIPVFTAGNPKKVDAVFLISVESPEGVRGVSSPFLVSYEQTEEFTIAHIYGRTLETLPYAEKMYQFARGIDEDPNANNVDRMAANLILNKGLSVDNLVNASKISERISNLFHSMTVAMFVEQRENTLFSYFPDEESKEQSFILSILIGAEEDSIKDISEDIIEYIYLRSKVVTPSFDKNKSNNKKLKILGKYRNHREVILSLMNDPHVKEYVDSCNHDGTIVIDTPDSWKE